jgi:hypothetical protein
MKAKTPEEILPPEILLAKAFNFTGEDLRVNQSGFLSRRQQGLFDVFLQFMLAEFLRIITRGRSEFKRRFYPAESVCGRVRLAHFVVDRPFQTGQGGSGTFHEHYTLKIDNSDVEFKLNKKQFTVLSEGIIYRIYYDPRDPKRILSLERPDGGCE